MSDPTIIYYGAHKAFIGAQCPMCNIHLTESTSLTCPPMIMQREAARREAVDHPAHYGGADNPYEAIKVIEAWSLDFCLGNAVKYISRTGKKSSEPEVQDLEKAKWYLERRIAQLKAKP